TKNLDSKNKSTLIKLLKLMKLRYKKTIIIATKDSEMILSLADQIYLLSENKLTKYEDKYIFFSDDKLLESYHLEQPKIIKFSKIVKEKTNISIGYRDNINDLIKDVYRYVDHNK
ncbi:MAG: hypothetical protein IJ093_03470, partial [Bacilli bacterium]|nr:hypothetical protein [Bacilli bacterium]